MSDALKYNFAGIEGAASASVDDGNVDSFASTGDDGQAVQKLAGIWGGSGSDAYQQTQQNWQTTAAEIDDLVLEDSSSEERSGVQYQQAADDAASSTGTMGFCKDAFDFTAMEAGSTDGCTGDACNGGAGGILFGDGGDGLNVEGKDDFATYDSDTITIGPGESFTYTLDPREPAILMEYAIML